MASEIIELKKTLSSMELELKANRGTISRLAAEAKQQHNNSSEYLSQMQTFVEEKEEQDMIRKDLIRQIDELNILNKKKDDDIESLTEHVKHLDENISNTKNRFSEEISSLRDFKNKVTMLLCNGDSLSHEFIFEKISCLKQTEMESNNLKKENERLSSILKLMPDEIEMNKIKNKIKSLENDLTDTSASLERRNRDDKKMMKFMNSLSSNFGIDKDEFKGDPDSLMDAILFRGKQLHMNEGSLVVDLKTQIYSMQRKIKSLNEVMTSKNFHLDLLKRKLSSLEERQSNKSDFEKEKDASGLKVKKLMKLVEKYKKDLQQATNDNEDLKDRLRYATKMTFETQTKENKLEEMVVHKRDLESLVESLNKDNNDGRRIKDKLKERHETETRDLLKKLEHKSTAILKLEEHLKESNIFKQKLSEILIINEALLEDNCSMITPSVNLKFSKVEDMRGEDIINKVKAIIESNKQNAATAYVLDSALSDMAEGLKVGYHKAVMNVSRESLPKPDTLDSFERSLKNVMSHS